MLSASKIDGVEIGVSQALVTETAQDLQQSVRSMAAKQQNLAPGSEVSIVDRNCLAGTDHRC
jgi:hypothetical protein